ncbi:MAG: VOC family protein [Sphingomonadaceae bacterium]
MAPPAEAAEVPRRLGMGPGQRIIQHAWVVPSIDAAARAWAGATGIGPFLALRHVRVGRPRHRGRPQATDFSVAVAQAGEVQVELVEQHDDGPSCYRDSVPAGGAGFHHVAVMSADYERELARLTAGGAEVAADGIFGDLRFAYVDLRPAIGCMVELVEDTPTIRAWFARIRSAAEGWDGQGPALVEAG